MGKRNKVIIGALPEDKGGFAGHTKHNVLLKILDLRAWCYANLKDPWGTYELNAGGGTFKYFIVFEFDSKKDEMLFRLYTGT